MTYRSTIAAIAMIVLATPAMAEVDGPPISNPTNDCRTATQAFGTAAFNACINQEQLYYDLAKDDWPKLGDKDKSFCVNLVNASRDRAGFYWGLETCLNERMREQANQTEQKWEN